jgi:hypothetical protein
MAAIDGPAGPKATRFDLTTQPSEEPLATVQAGESTFRSPDLGEIRMSRF